VLCAVARTGRSQHGAAQGSRGMRTRQEQCARAPPSRAPPRSPSRRNIVAHGILDSYRRSKGLSVESPAIQDVKDDSDAARGGVVAVAEPNIAMPELPPELAGGKLSHESVDSDVCPADCVIEIETREQLKALCRVRSMR
jgi:hypothetical protein